jgi:hypothetical protein
MPFLGEHGGGLALFLGCAGQYQLLLFLRFAYLCYKASVLFIVKKSRHRKRKYERLTLQIFRAASTLPRHATANRRVDVYSNERKDFFRRTFQSSGLVQCAAKVIHVAGTKGKVCDHYYCFSFYCVYCSLFIVLGLNMRIHRGWSSKQRLRRWSFHKSAPSHSPGAGQNRNRDNWYMCYLSIYFCQFSSDLF